MKMFKMLVLAATLSGLSSAGLLAAEKAPKAADHKGSKECNACCKSAKECDACCHDKGKGVECKACCFDKK